jgi:hypothetical protein
MIIVRSYFFNHKFHFYYLTEYKMAERKFFNITKRIPGIGLAHGAVRGLVYALKDDEDEMKYSWEMDLADLNPLRMPRNVANGVVGAFCRDDRGIWIGKRSLADQPFSLTISPGADVHHWCIRIDGIIYELGGSKSNVQIKIISKSDDPSLYESYCKRFSWTNLPQESCVSDAALRDYAKSFESERYHAIMMPDRINCQTFVVDMLARAANLTNIAAQSLILTYIPNIIF